jgi:hypothetical protein
MKDAQCAVFEKVARLPAENDDGLDGWTFAIPVGPEDATLLNVVIKRILEIDVPQKEILLCGRPGKNFAYWDDVRIVGEDIPAPPVRICTKKNRLVEEARYDNLCILHDRVFLPRDFGQAMRRFGDHYPFLTLQSLYFDDKYNLVPRRYSDFGTSTKVGMQPNLGLLRGNDVSKISPFAPTVLPLTEESGFYAANPLRHASTSYATGSLYIVKRRVWQACPQEDSLYWSEFEDLEQAFRADRMGIPSRVNAHAFSQSVVARPLLSGHGMILYETQGGGLAKYRPMLEPLRIPRKPLIKIAPEVVLQNLARFADKYVPQAMQEPLSSSTGLHMKNRLNAIVRTSYRIKVPLRRNAIAQMLLDFEKWVMLDQLPYGWREAIARNMLENGTSATGDLIEHNAQILNQASQRPKRGMFAQSLLDYLPGNNLTVRFGSLISALTLSHNNRRAFYFKGGLWARYKAIINTTPFLHYAKGQ